MDKRQRYLINVDKKKPATPWCVTDNEGVSYYFKNVEIKVNCQSFNDEKKSLMFISCYGKLIVESDIAIIF